MRIYVSRQPLANDTAYGYELRYLDFARMLMTEGITPHDLKEHYHDFEWVQGILHKEYQEIIKESVKDISYRYVDPEITKAFEEMDKEYDDRPKD